MGSLSNLVRAVDLFGKSLNVVFDDGRRQIEALDVAFIDAARTAGQANLIIDRLAGRRISQGVRDPLQPITTAGGNVVGEEVARRRRQARGLEGGPQAGAGGNTRGGLRANELTRGERDIVSAINGLQAGVLSVVGSSSSSYLRATGTVTGGGG